MVKEFQSLKSVKFLGLYALCHGFSTDHLHKCSICFTTQSTVRLLHGQ